MGGICDSHNYFSAYLIASVTSLSCMIDSIHNMLDNIWLKLLVHPNERGKIGFFANQPNVY